MNVINNAGKILLIVFTLFLLAGSVSAAETVEKTVFIDETIIVIPADQISSGVNTNVSSDSIAGMLFNAFGKNVTFYNQMGSDTMWFNLDELLGRVHKGDGSWSLYIDGEKIGGKSLPDWSNSTVKNGQVITLVYDYDNCSVSMKATTEKAQPTSAASPLPIAGILAGLAVAGLFFSRR
ncbi:MAG: hypothetical protein M0P20_08240 [Methanocorpusculum sp.]|jgi:hypothetical protein|nr:hypothetical protein [Methanocorpusculum sp.]MDD2470381.1 hypothetical protein [Methanocorpusculum sp.]MDD3257387.1 hypothetical protein [Methanocorpusculum sp.]MDD4132698.1 hypothetical protein [Methanocorpusculum sp.]